jgi:predicted nucleotidyltransferase
MNPQNLQPPRHHRRFIDRFVAACQADARVAAAFLGGSYATGTADAYSDLDLSVIATDAAYEDFYAGRAAFLGGLGEVVFLEDFDLPNIAFCILSDGVEFELWFGSENRCEHLHSGPYQVLLDKTGILAGADFPPEEPSLAEQREMLRRLIAWFWHDMSHFITAMARNQLWWAHGQLEALRNYCINLARLRANFLDPDVGSEAYFKVERAVPIAMLAPLEPTYCPLERGAMLGAAQAIVSLYQEQAQELAQTHELAYPAGLERVMLERLERVLASASL